MGDVSLALRSCGSVLQPASGVNAALDFEMRVTV